MMSFDSSGTTRAIYVDTTVVIRNIDDGQLLEYNASMSKSQYQAVPSVAMITVSANGAAQKQAEQIVYAK